MAGIVRRITWDDVVDFDPAFVTGLLGPLLTDPDVGYVKALYRRSLGDDDDGEVERGGHGMKSGKW